MSLKEKEAKGLSGHQLLALADAEELLLKGLSVGDEVVELDELLNVQAVFAGVGVGGSFAEVCFLLNKRGEI